MFLFQEMHSSSQVATHHNLAVVEKRLDIHQGERSFLSLVLLTAESVSWSFVCFAMGETRNGLNIKRAASEVSCSFPELNIQVQSKSGEHIHQHVDSESIHLPSD